MRARVTGTPERPRLAVFRSLKHIYAQVISEDDSRVLASASTLDKDVRSEVAYGGNVAAPVFAEIASYTARQLRVAPVAGEQVDAGPVRAPVSTLPVASDDEQTGED